MYYNNVSFLIKIFTFLKTKNYLDFYLFNFLYTI